MREYFANTCDEEEETVLKSEEAYMIIIYLLMLNQGLISHFNIFFLLQSSITPPILLTVLHSYPEEWD